MISRPRLLMQSLCLSIALIGSAAAGGPANPVLAVSHSPVVIFDSGAATPLHALAGPQMDRLLRSQEKARQDAVDRKVREQLPLIALPITTGLRVGALTRGPRLGKESVPNPFFLVGSDETSLNWLAVNQQALEKSGAFGFLIQASTEQDIATVLKVAKNIPIVPVGADLIAAQFRLTTYPVLVTARTIEQ